MLNRAKSNFLVTNRGNRLRLRRSFASSCCLPSNFVNIRFQGVRRVTRHFVIFAFIALFFLTQQGDCHLTNERKGYELQRALSFLERMQSNCSSPLYTVVGVGGGGGFASQFQEAASEWIRAAASLNYTVPVLLEGRIRGYTDGIDCAHVSHDVSCLFKSTSPCHESFIKVPASGPPSSVRANYQFREVDESTIPSQFHHMGLAWWWGVVQVFLFKLQPSVENRVLMTINQIDVHKIFKRSHIDVPLIGMHVRHGDKSTDGFRDHSLEAELAALRKSPECNSQVSKNISICFNSTSLQPIDIFVASDDTHVLAAAHKMGFLAVNSGVSQQTGGNGMFKTLMGHPEIGFHASLEIITDIVMLSRCSTLVGIAASQIFRMAVAMSNVTGRLVHATAMDHNQLPKIRHMSNKYHLPLPEIFELP